MKIDSDYRERHPEYVDWDVTVLGYYPEGFHERFDTEAAYREFGWGLSHFVYITPHIGIAFCWGSFDGCAAVMLYSEKGLFRPDEPLYLPDGTASEALRTAMVAKPRDAQYFGFVLNLGLRYGCDVVATDLRRIFDMMPGREFLPDEDIMAEIRGMTGRYCACRGDREMAMMSFTSIYYGMIAEEDKRVATGRNLLTGVGRLIKMLAVLSILLEGAPIGETVNCMDCRNGASKRWIRDESWRKFGLFRARTDYSDSEYLEEIRAAGHPV